MLVEEMEEKEIRPRVMTVPEPPLCWSTNVALGDAPGIRQTSHYHGTINMPSESRSEGLNRSLHSCRANSLKPIHLKPSKYKQKQKQRSFQVLLPIVCKLLT